MADLIPSNAGGNIWGHCDLSSTISLLHEGGMYMRLDSAIISDILYLFGQGNYFIFF